MYFSYFHQLQRKNNYMEEPFRFNQSQRAVTKKKEILEINTSNLRLASKIKRLSPNYSQAEWKEHD